MRIFLQVIITIALISFIYLFALQTVYSQDGGDGVSGAGSDNTSYDTGPTDSGNNNGDQSVDQGSGSEGGSDSSGDSGIADDGESFGDQSPQTQQDFVSVYGNDAAEAWANEHNAQIQFESTVENQLSEGSLENLGSLAAEIAQANGINQTTAANWAVQEALSRGATDLQIGGIAAQVAASFSDDPSREMTAAFNSTANSNPTTSQSQALDAAIAAGTAAGLDLEQVQGVLDQIAQANGLPPAAVAAAINPAPAPAGVTAEGAAVPAPGPAPQPAGTEASSPTSDMPNVDGFSRSSANSFDGQIDDKPTSIYYGGNQYQSPDGNDVKDTTQITVNIDGNKTDIQIDSQTLNGQTATAISVNGIVTETTTHVEYPGEFNNAAQVQNFLTENGISVPGFTSK